jgi:hypothetical protein
MKERIAETAISGVLMMTSQDKLHQISLFLFENLSASEVLGVARAIYRKVHTNCIDKCEREVPFTLMAISTGSAPPISLDVV